MQPNFSPTPEQKTKRAESKICRQECLLQTQRKKQKLRKFSQKKEETMRRKIREKYKKLRELLQRNNIQIIEVPEERLEKSKGKIFFKK